LVPASWGGRFEEFDLEIWGAAVNLTAMKLVGASLETLVLSDDAIDSLDTGTEVLTSASHAFLTGDGPVRVTTTGALPGGLVADTDYFIRYLSANTYSLHPSRETALANTQAINLTSSGSGTNNIVDTADTKRVHWLSMGFLGESGDGAITIAAQVGYRVRCKHSPRVWAYSLVGTLSSAVAINATIYPVSRSWGK
jgi:hypothetical protein